MPIRRDSQRSPTARLESVDLYRSSFDQATIGLVIATIDGEIVRANAAFARMLGYSPDELIARSLTDVIHTDDQSVDITHHLLQQVTSGSPLNTREGRYRRRDGSFVWGSLSISVVRDAHGQPGHLRCEVGDITARKELEERVRESERRAVEQARQLEATFTSMLDAAIVCDTEGRIRIANPAFRALVEAPDDFDLASMLPADRIRLLDVRSLQGQTLRADEMPTVRSLTGERLLGAARFDHRLRSFGDREVEVSVSGTPLADVDGKITGAVAIMRDVTEKRRLEREAQGLARLLDGTFDAIGDAVLVYDRTGRVVRANAAVRALFGITADARFGELSMAERARALPAWDEQGREIPADQRPGPRALRGETLLGSAAMDERVRTLDGRDIWTSCSAAPVRDVDGEISGAILIVRNVTERRALEQKTHDALAAIIEAARLLVLPPQTAGDIDSSEAVAEGLARCIRRVLDRRTATSLILMRVEDDGATKFLAAAGFPNDVDKRLGHLIDGISLASHFPDPIHQEWLREGRSFTLDLTRPPYEYVRPELWSTETLIVPLQIGRQLIGILVLKPHRRDHTYTRAEIDLAETVGQLAAIVVERSRLRREREDAVTRARALEETQHRMDEFLGIASHELRTPLTSIKASLQLTAVYVAAILDSVRDEPSRAEHHLTALFERLERAHQLLRRSDRHLARMTDLVTNMLDVSQFQRGELGLRQQPCDVAVIVRAAVEGQQLVVPRRTINLDDRSTSATVVLADPQRIGQVVDHYLINALKYSGSDQPVQVDLTTADGWVRVAVSDAGPGLSLAQQRQIWERFHRVSGIAVQSGSGLGLGLGLFLSRTIVEHHGGQVGVDSTPGAGSTFWFRLPLRSSRQHDHKNGH